MPSPFPGINPYLEQEDIWHDFHERFIPALAEVLGPQVRPNYIVKLDRHVYSHEVPADERRLVGRFYAGVAEGPRAEQRPAGGPTTMAPAYGQVPLAIDTEREAFVEVRDRQSRELITVIELLSPANKRPGSDREQYLAKRWQFLQSPVNLVEIDLLRGWPRLPIEGLPACDYCVLVSRAGERPRVGLWPIRLRDRLPNIPIPLRGMDADARVDLQDLVHRVYDAAGYADYAYSSSPEPPLDAESAQWAAQLVPSR